MKCNTNTDIMVVTSSSSQQSKSDVVLTNFSHLKRHFLSFKDAISQTPSLSIHIIRSSTLETILYTLLQLLIEAMVIMENSRKNRSTASPLNKHNATMVAI
jgi:hypothetical protein